MRIYGLLSSKSCELYLRNFVVESTSVPELGGEGIKLIMAMSVFWRATLPSLTYGSDTLPRKYCKSTKHTILSCSPRVLWVFSECLLCSQIVFWEVISNLFFVHLAHTAWLLLFRPIEALLPHCVLELLHQMTPICSTDNCIITPFGICIT